MAEAERGQTTIAPKVIERLAVAAAREAGASTSTRDGLAGIVKGKLPRASAEVAGGTSRVSVEVAARWSQSLADVAGHVRDHVSERVSTLAGVDVTSVDVTVAEIVHQRDLSPRVH